MVKQNKTTNEKLGEGRMGKSFLLTEKGVFTIDGLKQNQKALLMLCKDIAVTSGKIKTCIDLCC